MARKKILVMPDGNWLAHVSRPLKIAKNLREMGHEIIFAGTGKYMELARQEDFLVVPLETIDPDKVLRQARKGRVNWHNYKDLKKLVQEELAALGEIKPDLVLTDFRPSTSISCKVSKTPLAVVLNASWTNYYTVKIKNIEHSRVGQAIKKTAIGRGIARRFELAERIKGLILVADSSPFKRICKEMGLIPCSNFFQAMEGDLNLVCDIPEYGPTKNLPSNFYYTGPIIWEPTNQSSQWLSPIDPNKPTLYFTMGSTGYARFFEEAIRIFGNTKYQCIMTTGGMVKIQNPPKNFFVVDYAPGSKIMEKSGVVVCHGGNGTIYQAMSQGVPIIGIPTMHDQEFNMQRVVDLGIGIQLSEIGFKPINLIKAVEKILSQKKYKENAQVIKNKLTEYNGPKKAAELINNALTA